MRFVVRVFLFWQRTEVLLASLLSLGLILESSIANGFAYAGTDLSWGHVVEAMLRGFFLEVFTYCSARLAKSLATKNFRRSWFGCVLMAVLCLVAVFVSAGNNFVWVAGGHNLPGLLGSIGALFGSVSSPWVRVYELGLSMLLPIAVAGIALVDTSPLVEAALNDDRLDNRAVDVEEKELLRSAYLRGMRAQRGKLEQAFQGIAKERAELQIERLRQGALSNGLPSEAFSTALPSPSAAAPVALPAPQQDPPMAVDRIVTGQFQELSSDDRGTKPKLRRIDKVSS